MWHNLIKDLNREKNPEKQKAIARRLINFFASEGDGERVLNWIETLQRMEAQKI